MKAKIKVSGMDCASDTHNIEKSLLKINGVKNVTVNYVVETAFVEHSARASESDLKKGITDAGFEVVSIDSE